MFFGGYRSSKLKPQLKMAVTRFQISGNKKSALMKQQIREIAMLLAAEPPKEEKARIKAEALIRDDNTVEAYEILQLNCELLSERMHYISNAKECPPDLESCISTLIWASAIVDIPELIEIRKQFRYKYGKEFETAAMQNLGGVLNERVAARLSVQPPSAYMVQTYLEKIADEQEVKWKPRVPLRPENMAEPMPAPGGYSVSVGGASGLNSSTFVEGGLDANNNNNGLGPSAPPMSPSFSIPEAPKSSASTVSSTSMGSTNNPSSYVPVLPNPSRPNKHSSIDDIVEEDIFVPGAPKNPPGGGVNGHNKYDDDDDDNEGDYQEEQRSKRGSFQNVQSVVESPRGTAPPAPPADGGGGGDESYDDLAARFATLNK